VQEKTTQKSKKICILSFYFLLAPLNFPSNASQSMEKKRNRQEPSGNILLARKTIETSAQSYRGGSQEVDNRTIWRGRTSLTIKEVTTARGGRLHAVACHKIISRNQRTQKYPIGRDSLPPESFSDEEVGQSNTRLIDRTCRTRRDT